MLSILSDTLIPVLDISTLYMNILISKRHYSGILDKSVNFQMVNGLSRVGFWTRCTPVQEQYWLI